MKCAVCGYNNKDWSISCSSCGKDFKQQTETEIIKEEQEDIVESETKDKNNTAISPYPYIGAIKSLNYLLALKEENSRRIWTLYFGIMLIGIIFASEDFNKYSKNIIIIAIVLFFIASILIFLFSIITATNYYNIPTAKDKKNQHRCIFCGSTSIHKRFIVKDILSTNHCSSCEKFLYYRWFNNKKDSE